MVKIFIAILFYNPLPIKKAEPTNKRFKSTIRRRTYLK